MLAFSRHVPAHLVHVKLSIAAHMSSVASIEMLLLLLR